MLGGLYAGMFVCWDVCMLGGLYAGIFVCWDVCMLGCLYAGMFVCWDVCRCVVDCCVQQTFSFLLAAATQNGSCSDRHFYALFIRHFNLKYFEHLTAKSGNNIFRLPIFALFEGHHLQKFRAHYVLKSVTRLFCS